MNFNTNTAYSTAVNNFEWTTLEVDTSLTDYVRNLDGIVNEVSKKIIAASQLKPMLSLMAGRELSLSDTFYVTVQDLDRRAGKNTVAAMTSASLPNKVALNYTFRKLSELFTSVAAGDLKVGALLFGIQSIQALATPVLSAPSAALALPSEEKKQTPLEHLIALRDRNLLSETAPAAARDFMQRVDAVIEAASTGAVNQQAAPKPGL